MLCEAPMFCVDMGTTRTRVWLVEDGRIWSFSAADFGLRDVAQGMTPEGMEMKLRGLLEIVAADAAREGLKHFPACIAAAGMITSPKGLRHLPHISAPAGLEDLRNSVERAPFHLDQMLPIYFVAGVATGTVKGGVDSVLSSDLMRGEETLCMGLLARGHITAGSAVLNLGSHWKWIFIDANARISRSRTSLTGEMIHAVQTQTLLATALPGQRPDALNTEWLDLGCAEAARSGLSRALFCVRLLEQSGTTTPEQRIAFLYGAFLEAEIHALLGAGLLSGLNSVCIIGATAVATVWQRRLAAENVTSFFLPEQQRDLSYLAGLQQILGPVIHLRNGFGPSDDWERQ